MKFDEILREQRVAEAEILTTVRMQYGEDAAEVLGYLANQARSLTAMIGMSRATFSPLLSREVEDKYFDALHKTMVDVLMFSTAIAMTPFKDDEKKRSELTAFAVSLSRRAIDNAARAMSSIRLGDSDA